MSLMNLRLAYWLPNPGRVRDTLTTTSTAPGTAFRLEPPGPIYLVREIFGKVDDSADYVHVSDGGHHENLGALELLRRRCRLIVIGDSEADPSFSFGGLNRLRHLAQGVGAQIDINQGALAQGPSGLSSEHYAVGRVTYDGGEVGTLIYIKASLTGDEDQTVLAYRTRSRKFPHEPTSQQFYTDEQFEAYRKLGYHIGRTLCRQEEERGRIRYFSASWRSSGERDFVDPADLPPGSPYFDVFARLADAGLRSAAAESGGSSLRVRRIYGRGQILDEVVQRVLQEGSRTILTGPAGIGKSEFQRTLQQRLRARAPDRPCLRHEIGSASVEGGTPLSVQHLLSVLTAQLMGQLFEMAAGQVAGVHERLSRIAGRVDWDRWSEATSKLVEHTAPASAMRGAEHPLPGAGPDVTVLFQYVLSVLSAEGCGGSILIDRAEACTPALEDALAALIDSLPDGWALVLTANDELPEGIEVLERLTPALFRRGGRRSALPPLDATAVRLWYEAARNEQPDPAELRSVVESCQGRPLHIKDWIDGLVSVEETRFLVERQVGGYYEHRLSLLNDDARWLLRRVALLPHPALFSFEFCHALRLLREEGADAEATWSIIRALKRQNFIVELPEVRIPPDAYAFTHEVTQRQVFDQTPQGMKREGARDVVAAMEAAPQALATVDLQYARLVLAEMAGHAHLVQRLALPTAAALTQADAYGPARRALAICISALPRDGNAYVEALIRSAQLATMVAEYQEARHHLEELDNRELDTKARAIVDLAWGELLLRINDYHGSAAALAKAEARFVELGDVERQLHVATRVNTAMRDIGDYAKAVDQAQSSVRLAERHQVEPLTLAGCYRSLARSLALRGDWEESVRAANKALNLATGRSIRAEGNACLALGEGYRHGRQLPEAARAYSRAVAIGESIGNRDSLMWSLLGLADTYFLQHQSVEAREALSRVAELVGRDRHRHPLEFLHWQLSMACLDFSEGVAGDEALVRAAESYRQFAIKWPAEYVQRLQQDRVPVMPKPM